MPTKVTSRGVIQTPGYGPLTFEVPVPMIEEKIWMVKKLFRIKLDAPEKPVIGPNETHTYSIDLGAVYKKIVLTDFNWQGAKLENDVPEPVIANACFEKSKFGGILIANGKKNSWVRAFELKDAEYQNGEAVDVDATWGDHHEDGVVPLGYGKLRGQSPFTHANVSESTPPKKLQIEDVHLEGRNLTVTIKNCDSVAIDLSPYVGVKALVHNDRAADIVSVSEEGKIAYTSWAYSANPGVHVSEDGGSSWKTYDPGTPKNDRPYPNGLTITGEGVNTIIGFLNYQRILTASAPTYEFGTAYEINKTSPKVSTVHWQDPANAQRPHGGRTFDWKKTASGSCALFVGFHDYHNIHIFKSVDDCKSFGNNAPTFDNNASIFTTVGGTFIPDYYRARAPEDNTGTGIKTQVKVIDNNTHFLCMSYWAFPENFVNGPELTEVYVGPQTIKGINDYDFVLRENCVLYRFPGGNFNNNVPISALVITGSVSSANNRTVNVRPTVYKDWIETYFRGEQIISGTQIYTDEIGVLESDFNQSNTLSGSVPGDVLDVGSGLYSALSLPGDRQITIAGIRTADIGGFNYKIIKLFTFSKYNSGEGGAPNTVPASGIDELAGTKTHLPNSGVRWFSEDKSRWWLSGKPGDVYLMSRIDPSETPFQADSHLTNSNLRLKLMRNSSSQKQKLMKTSDGGATWSSVMEHPEFRYANTSVFHASNDGQTLFLAAMKYWGSLGKEKFPYPLDGMPGNTACFNISFDGGATWRNPSGSWDLIATGTLLPTSIRESSDMNNIMDHNAQVIGTVDDSIMAILLDQYRQPAMFKSDDKGKTWSSKQRIDFNDYGGWSGATIAHVSDSKDQFMAFFGHYYSNTEKQSLFFGTSIDEYTSWGAFGVK